ncbi:MAG: ABC transporter ATP-binding protein [Actinomycetota bacterium]|nr:ABC transporter ATP-binding protein [Actinomycetota bacterium]
MAPLLSVRDLSVTFTRRGRRDVHAVDGVSFDVEAGQTIGIVGESGSGKSVTSLAALGLLPKRGVRITGEARFDDRDLLRMSDSELRNLRGSDVTMVFQDPLSSLNPVLTLGRQITEVLERHRGLGRDAARSEAADALEMVGIPDPKARLASYPHQLSGGMRQRAMIAMALACRPRLLIADEPTTALDVTIQAQILELLKALVRDSGAALVLITHDLGVVAGLCEQVRVMYAGRIVETATRQELFGRPRHPYTRGLLASVPRLDQPRGTPLQPIPGSPSDTIAWPSGCAFAPRCANRVEGCTDGPPGLHPDEHDASHLFRCINPAAVPERAQASR